MTSPQRSYNMSRIRSSIILDMGAGPSAYGRGTANILACSLETVVAEKMHTVIDLQAKSQKLSHTCKKDSCLIGTI